MDAYVLGALPPYNTLLCGKMVACLIRSREVYNEFTRTYGNTSGIISGKAKKARLLAVTTSSSMGRSSVYNRLKLGSVRYFETYRLHPRMGPFPHLGWLVPRVARLPAQHRPPICRPAPLRAGSKLAPANHACSAQGARIQRRTAPPRHPTRGYSSATSRPMPLRSCAQGKGRPDLSARFSPCSRSRISRLIGGCFPAPSGGLTTVFGTGPVFCCC